jgi:hypothetical protein
MDVHEEFNDEESTEDCSRDSEEDEPSSSAKRKYRGAAVYNSKFDPVWKKTYPCVQPIKGDVYSFHCTLCRKDVSCKHMGISDVKRHLEGVTHKRAADSMKSQTTLIFAGSSSDKRQKVRICPLSGCAH